MKNSRENERISNTLTTLYRVRYQSLMDMKEHAAQFSSFTKAIFKALDDLQNVSERAKYHFELMNYLDYDDDNYPRLPDLAEQSDFSKLSFLEQQDLLENALAYLDAVALYLENKPLQGKDKKLFNDFLDACENATALLPQDLLIVA